MDLLNPDVRREFVESVVNVLRSENETVDYKLLDRFVFIMSDTRTLFPVPLDEMAEMFRLDMKSLRRLIDPTLSRSERTEREGFTENRDFIYIEKKGLGPRPFKEMYLTLSTFGKLVFRLHSHNARVLQAYYRVVEKLYREWAGNVIATKQRSVRENKIPLSPKVDLMTLPKGELAYLFNIKQNENDWLKPGHTAYLPGRITNLQFQYPGQFSLLQSKRMNHSAAQEECFKRLAEEHLISCSQAPCPEEIFYKDFDQDLAWKVCSEGQDEILQKYKTALLEHNTPSSHAPRMPEGSQGFAFRTKNGIKRL
jgi:hypothetical protein